MGRFGIRRKTADRLPLFDDDLGEGNFRTFEA